MTSRFLAMLLFAMIGLAAFDAFELRRDWSASAATPASQDSSLVRTMDGGNPYPPKP
jgi:hypothetical protein